MEKISLRLSCVCCGTTEIKNTEQPYYTIEDKHYLLHDDLDKAKVVCSKCGLEDYIENLVIKLKAYES